MDKLREYKKKIKELELDLADDPNSIDLLTQLARFYNLTVQYNKAINICNKVLKLEEKNKLASNNLFYAYDMLEDFESALRVLERYLADFQLEKKQGLRIFGFIELAQEFFTQRKEILYEEASQMPFFRPSEVIDINFSTFFHFSRIGWSERNTEVLSLILEIYPQDVDILIAKAYSYLLRNELSEAKALLDKALFINGTDFIANMYLGYYYRKVRKYIKAEEVLNHLLRQQSFAKFQSDKFRLNSLNNIDVIRDYVNYIAILIELGAVYCDSGRYKQSIEHFLRLLKTSGYGRGDSSYGARINDYLGRAYQALGYNKQAFKILKTALRMDPSSVEVLTSLGNFYLERKMYYQALKVNEKCLRINPKYKPALKLQKDLSHHQKDLR